MLNTSNKPAFFSISFGAYAKDGNKYYGNPQTRDELIDYLKFESKIGFKNVNLPTPKQQNMLSVLFTQHYIKASLDGGESVDAIIKSFRTLIDKELESRGVNN